MLFSYTDTFAMQKGIIIFVWKQGYKKIEQEP